MSFSLLNLLPHTSHSTFFSPVSRPLCCAIWCAARFCLHALLHFPLSCATLYQSLSICTAFRSFFATSLHLLLGPPQGRVWGSHPNRHILGSLWSLIQARCPSYSGQRRISLVSIVSTSPHYSLTAAEEMCSSHCLWLVISNTVHTHL